jgi:hypothetical protein
MISGQAEHQAAPNQTLIELAALAKRSQLGGAQ